MGRKKIEIEKLTDERIRRVTFKKRRIGLLKKAIQLSKLTDAQVILRIYHSEDNSLIEY
jgi:MADS-box transcription factor